MSVGQPTTDSLPAAWTGGDLTDICCGAPATGPGWPLHGTPRATQLEQGSARSHLSFFERHKSHDVWGCRRRCSAPSTAAAAGNLRFVPRVPSSAIKCELARPGRREGMKFNVGEIGGGPRLIRGD